ncbi:2-amino-4-hydroxy-6-hydroxymethyldihydropteridine diphosphokinase [Qipengyuania sp.]|uniref:2-amino-4-hydroxy-6- hydroxymethyldihydropteridine diphosphokinase n=1 Tax=Qipengyuania sp. TaxID=2004515 RepID=UPI0035C7FCA4
MRVPGVGGPRKVLGAAVDAMQAAGLALECVSPTLDTVPIGPSHRRFANAAAIVSCDLDPPRFLAALQEIERSFGRRRRGQPWRARPLDLDIILWSGGVWDDRDLAIPHPSFAIRDFVLGPASRIAPEWRDADSGLTVRQLHARLTARRPLPRGAAVVGPLAQSVEQLTFNQ